MQYRRLGGLTNMYDYVIQYPYHTPTNGSSFIFFRFCWWARSSRRGGNEHVPSEWVMSSRVMCTSNDDGLVNLYHDASPRKTKECIPYILYGMVAAFLGNACNKSKCPREQNTRSEPFLLGFASWEQQGQNSDLLQHPTPVLLLPINTKKL